ncbi:hypothetical protein OHB41_51285 [Streptomyces sp. NBC_01571]|uniref:hypothetical protein n=1 Tax=Streptomyces sp. NBC_01571 TaxID=2975883 RepID=UPI00225238A4|nr:hypothetical protein [Streptomyces sp. NBC_01571]MCX4581343.1 hypothetical protein [Streptomyces sp. NBC_01571]
MPRITKARMAREADYFENVAARRSDAAAADGERVAADPTRSDYTRACAARAAKTARENAAEYRHIAAELRAGEIPDCLDLS